MTRGWWLAAIACLALAPVRSLPAQATPDPQAASADTALERKVREVASMLRCPVCLNLSVQDSPSELARDMRDVVRDRLRQGDTEQQVLDYFIQRYGEWVLMKPPAHGVSLLVWLLPVVLVVGGGALVVFAMKRWIRRPAAVTATGPEEIGEQDLRKVREALAKERGRLD